MVFKTVTPEMIEAFAEISGDRNRLHFDDVFAKKTLNGKCNGRIAHGALIFALLSGYIAHEFGDGTTVRKAECCFKLPFEPGDGAGFSHTIVASRTVGSAVLADVEVSVVRQSGGVEEVVGKTALVLLQPL